MQASVRPWKPPGEGDDRGALGMEARDLDRVLDGLRAGAQEDGFLRRLARGERVELLGEGDVALVGRHLKAGVDEAVELLRDRCLDFRVHVPGIEHGDAAGEIDVALAFDVPELRVGSAVGVDGQGVRDSARNGVLAALLQFGVGRQSGSPARSEARCGESCGILSECLERAANARRAARACPRTLANSGRHGTARRERPSASVMRCGAGPSTMGGLDLSAEATVLSQNPSPVPGQAITAEVVIIGAGPCGLFQVFELGLLGIGAHLVDSLAHPGGQCAELYPEKPIYDIPALPVCGAQELVDRLMKQIEPFHPSSTSARKSSSSRAGRTGASMSGPTTGTTFDAGAVVIAAGVGSFQPRRIGIEGSEAFEGSALHYRVKNSSTSARPAPGDLRRRRFGARLDAGAAAQSAQRDARSPPARVPRRAGLGRQDAGTCRGRTHAAVRGAAAFVSSSTTARCAA